MLTKKDENQSREGLFDIDIDGKATSNQPDSNEVELSPNQTALVEQNSSAPEKAKRVSESTNSEKEKRASKSTNTEKRTSKSTNSEKRPFKSTNTEITSFKSTNTEKIPFKSTNTEKTSFKSTNTEKIPFKSTNTEKRSAGPGSRKKDQQFSSNRENDENCEYVDEECDMEYCDLQSPRNSKGTNTSLGSSKKRSFGSQTIDWICSLDGIDAIDCDANDLQSKNRNSFGSDGTRLDKTPKRRSTGNQTNDGNSSHQSRKSANGTVKLKVFTPNAGNENQIQYEVENIEGLDSTTRSNDFDWDNDGNGDGCDDFCVKVCGHKPEVELDPCLGDRPSWINYHRPGSDKSKCHALKFRDRVNQYIEMKSNHDECKVTKAIVDDRGHLLQSWKQETSFKQKRPLWGVPTSQWEIDEAQGKRGYKPLRPLPPDTPLPSYFKPLPPIPGEICAHDDAQKKPQANILVCRTPFCPRKFLRAVYRDYRGKQPRPSVLRETIVDPFTKKLQDELQALFEIFLLRKVPIIWIYGRPIKSIAEIRRRHCIQLAQIHGFTYISLDDEIARLAAKGSRAIRAKNPTFEGFHVAERLAIPISMKLVQDKNYSLSREQTLEMLKYIMLQNFPTNGYVIDGFPWDDMDNEEFEKYFYPIACGLYFLDSKWTADKTNPPEVIPPLYFRRKDPYNEFSVEEAVGNFGLKTLKIINAESLDEDTSYAVHAVVDEYLDAYDEVLEGNEDVLRDSSLELQTFGETVGFGLDLERYVKRKHAKPDEGETENETVKNEMAENEKEHKLELDPLKEIGWEGSKAKGEFTSAMFNTEDLKVTPSKRKLKADGTFEDGEGDDGEEGICPEGEEGVCKKEKKSRKGKYCKCRCKCSRRRNRRKRKVAKESTDTAVGFDDSDSDKPRTEEGVKDEKKQRKASEKSHRKGGYCRCNRRRRKGSKKKTKDGNEEDDEEGKGKRGSKDGSHGSSSESSSEGRSSADPDADVSESDSDQSGSSSGVGSTSQADAELGDGGPYVYVYDKQWGFRSIRRTGKNPDIRIPPLESPNLQTNFVDKEGEVGIKAAEKMGIYALPHIKSHQIPDAYNGIPGVPKTREQKPGGGDNRQGPNVLRTSASEKYTFSPKAIPEAEKKPELARKLSTPFAGEPNSGLKAFFSDSMSRLMGKNQADIRKIKYEKLKHKVAQVEYEIYQDDYRLPKYRFYKKYKDYTPEDFIKEKQNWVPCAECFDSFKQADEFDKGEQLITLSHIQHDRHEAKEEQEHRHGKGPLFNRIISCLCGEDNEAGYHLPGYKPEAKQVDDNDIDQFNELPNYKKRKEIAN